MLKLYADESGTNDPTGKQPGSQVPVLCGFIATVDDWKQFCKEWQAVLDDYHAPYFHFREFANKLLYAKASSPYYQWSEKKREKFLYELALTASEAGVPIGGFYYLKEHHDKGLVTDPYRHVVEMFHNDFCAAMNDHWPEYKDKVAFVFDSTTDKEWIHLLVELQKKSSGVDSRFGVVAFDDDKKVLPLQAADMYAYVTRQQAERFMSNNRTAPPLRAIDLILGRRMYASWQPKPMNPCLAKLAWRLTIKLVLEDQRRQKAIWVKQRMPNKKYYPEEHFPFEKYGFHRRKDTV